MLIRCTEVLKWTLKLHGGCVGQLEDCFFDDHRWALRYFIASGFEGIRGRKLLITPGDLDGPDPERNALCVHLSQDQARQTRSIAADLPVSGAPAGESPNGSDRHKHWGVVPVPAIGSLPLEVTPSDPSPGPSSTDRPKDPIDRLRESMPGLPRLRGLGDLRGLRVRGEAGQAGTLRDLILDTDPWEASHLLVAAEDGDGSAGLLLAPCGALATGQQKELRLRLPCASLPAVDGLALQQLSRRELDLRVRRSIDSAR